MVEMRMRDALREALREEMLRDERIFLLGEDIGLYGGSYAVTKGLLEEFGEERVRDTPIAESAIVGIGIGAAMGGMHPMVEIMTINFSFLALDQIVNNAAKLLHMSNGQINVPLVIRMASGGGSQLAATHSHSLEGLYAHFPGLKVVCPSTPADAKGLLKRAFRDENTVIFIEHTANYGLRGEVPDDPDFLVEFGVANVVREGTDVTIVGYSGSVHQAIRAAQLLEEQEEISAEVIDLRTLRPLDIDTVITSVKKTNRAVIVEMRGSSAASGVSWRRRSWSGPSTGWMRRWRAWPARMCRCPTIGISSSTRCHPRKTWSRRSSGCSRSKP
jgi:pyruvate dehydrogenase E1 component beta subunit